MRRTILLAAIAAALTIPAAALAAPAPSSPLIHGSQIANGAVSHSKLNGNSVWNNDLGAKAVSCGKLTLEIQGELKACGGAGDPGAKGDTGLTGQTGPAGPQGPKGDTGATGFEGSFYSVEQYPEGAGSGAIATAACDPNDAARSQTFAAISGGAQDTDNSTDMSTLGGGGDNPPAPLPIAATFPGRMDFSGDTTGTPNTPKPGRLDGWIIQLAPGAGADTPMEVWAYCVPVSDDGGNVPVVVNSAG